MANRSIGPKMVKRINALGFIVYLLAAGCMAWSASIGTPCSQSLLLPGNIHESLVLGESSRGFLNLVTFYAEKSSDQARALETVRTLIESSAVLNPFKNEIGPLEIQMRSAIDHVLAADTAETIQAEWPHVRSKLKMWISTQQLEQEDHDLKTIDTGLLSDPHELTQLEFGSQPIDHRPVIFKTSKGRSLFAFGTRDGKVHVMDLTGEMKHQIDELSAWGSKSSAPTFFETSQGKIYLAIPTDDEIYLYVVDEINNSIRRTGFGGMRLNGMTSAPVGSSPEFYESQNGTIYVAIGHTWGVFLFSVDTDDKLTHLDDSKVDAFFGLKFSFVEDDRGDLFVAGIGRQYLHLYKIDSGKLKIESKLDTNIADPSLFSFEWKKGKDGRARLTIVTAEGIQLISMTNGVLTSESELKFEKKVLATSNWMSDEDREFMIVGNSNEITLVELDHEKLVKSGQLKGLSLSLRSPFFLSEGDQGTIWAAAISTEKQILIYQISGGLISSGKTYDMKEGPFWLAWHQISTTSQGLWVATYTSGYHLISIWNRLQLK